MRRSLFIAGLVTIMGCHASVQSGQPPETVPAMETARGAYSAAIATPGDPDDPVLWFDTSADCGSRPEINRVFTAEEFVWGNKTMVAINAGNEVWLFELVNGTLVWYEGSNFNIPNVGDSDYDLVNFSFCDDCRYGVANYKAGTVVFDLGATSSPSFVSRRIFPDAYSVPGAFTFKDGGSQYLVATALGGACSGSTLYEIGGGPAIILTVVECVTMPARRTEIVGGDRVGNALYLVDKSTRVYLYEIQPGPHLEYRSTPWTAYGVTGSAQSFDALSIDALSGIATVANSGGLDIYAISDPFNPVKVGHVDGNWNRSSTAAGMVAVAKKGHRGSEHTFNVLVPSNPQPLNQDFWGAGHDYNYADHDCAEIQDLIFVANGAFLVILRYSIGQKATTGDWLQSPVTLIFADGFESGDLSAWDEVMP